MTLIKTGAIVFLMFSVFSGEAFAVEVEPKCNNPGVLQTDYWKAFHSMVEDEYFRDYRTRSASSDRDPGDLEMDTARFFGHALGRLAKAVNNDSDRREIYDCVQLGVYQIIGLISHRLPLGLLQSGYLFDLVKESSISN